MFFLRKSDWANYNLLQGHCVYVKWNIQISTSGTNALSLLILKLSQLAVQYAISSTLFITGYQVRFLQTILGLYSRLLIYWQEGIHCACFYVWSWDKDRGIDDLDTCIRSKAAWAVYHSKQSLDKKAAACVHPQSYFTHKVCPNLL